VRPRAALLGLLLFAVYAGTLGLDAFASSDYGGDEPHYLLAAKSLVEDGDLDVLDQYAAREYSTFYPLVLEPQSVETMGRLHEPHGVGFPLLIAPAFALAGETGVELFLAAIAALAGVLAYVLARRVTPDPWALGAGLAAGLSPPLLAYGTAVYPELAAGVVLAGAALLALRLEERTSHRAAIGCFALLAMLPWLGTKFVPAGAVIGVAATRWLLRRNRRLLALGGAEILGASVVLYLVVNDRLYGGPTPYTAEGAGQTATDALSAADVANRAYRVVALAIDRDYGLLRWAPVFALTAVGALLLLRARRERLEAALPGHHTVQLTAGLCLCALVAQYLVAAFAAPTMFGFWFPPRHFLAALPLAVPLMAWGLRRLPRAGLGLVLIGLVASVWLYVDVRLGEGGLAAGRPPAPWGPLEAAFPRFDDDVLLPFVVAAVLAVVAVVLIALESRHWRQTAGATRRRYSG